MMCRVQDVTVQQLGLPGIRAFNGMSVSGEPIKDAVFDQRPKGEFRLAVNREQAKMIF